jgi:uncharacterized protein (DUF1330 family)
MAIVPNRAQFEALAAHPDDSPVVMLNLIKFKAGGGEGEYRQYGDQAVRMVQQRGGRLLWHGKPQQALIGDPDWDYVALVEYPSRKAFLDMVTNPDYLKAHNHREAAVERTELLACGALRWAGRSTSSRPISSATTAWAATAAQSPGPPSPTNWPPLA